jgi:hypothetical protein
MEFVNEYSEYQRRKADCAVLNSLINFNVSTYIYFTSFLIYLTMFFQTW